MRSALTGIRTWHFNPLCTSEAEARQWLQDRVSPSSSDETPSTANPAAGHAVALDGSAWAFPLQASTGMEPDANGMIHVDLSGIEPSVFLSSVALGDAAEALMDRIEREPTLSAFKGWDVDIVAPGTVFEVDLVDDGICSFVSTKKTGGFYFDYVAYLDDRSATYSHHTAIQGLRHSGDIGSLLHTLRATDALPLEKPVALAVVGFQRKMLRIFSEQVPLVCVPSPAERVLRVVPCPLDEATVEDNTMACLVSMERLPGARLRFCVSNRPPAVRDINTNQVDDRTQACVAMLATEAESLVAAAAATVTQPATTAASRPAGGDDGSADGAAAAAAAAEIATDTDSTTAADTLVLVEDGLGDAGKQVVDAAVESTANTLCCSFGVGIRVLKAPARKGACRSYAAAKAPLTVLPCIAGPCSGIAAAALGRSFDTGDGAVSPAAYSSTLRGAVMRVVHCSDRFLESAKNGAEEKLNAVFVVHPTRSLSDKRTVPGQNRLEARLSDVNISAVSAMAGPASIVLVELDGRRYWYRGVAWRGLIDSVPKFGADVTSRLSDGVLLGADRGTFTAPVRPVVAKDDTSIEYRGKMLTPDEVVSAVLELPLEQLPAQRREVERALAQMQVALSAAQLEPRLRAMTEALVAAVAARTAKAQSMLRRALDQAAAVADGEAETKAPAASFIADAGRRALNVHRESAKSVQWLIDALGACLSVKGTATRRHDLGRLARKATIAKNVQAAKSMSKEDLWTLLEDACHEGTGALVAHIDIPALVQCLSSVSPSMMDHTYCKAVHNHPSPVKIEPRLTYIDGCTAAALLENASSGSEGGGQLAPKAGTGERSLAIGGIDRRPALPLPLLTKYVDMRRPEAIDWLSECNESNVARLRILLRGTLSQSIASRNFDLPPQARDIGFLVVDLVLQALASAAANAGTPPLEQFTTAAPSSSKAGEAAPSQPRLSFDDTLAQVARGIVGFTLATLASGATPLSPAWQLVRRELLPDVPRHRESWWLYARLGQAFVGWTCWQPRTVIRNSQFIAAVLLLREALVPALPWAMRMVSGPSMLAVDCLPGISRQCSPDAARGCLNDLLPLLADRLEPLQAYAKRVFDAGATSLPAVIDAVFSCAQPKLTEGTADDFAGIWTVAAIGASHGAAAALRCTFLEILLRWAKLQHAAKNGGAAATAPQQAGEANPWFELFHREPRPRRERGSKRRGSDQDGEGAAAAAGDEEVRCYACGKTGHFARDCPDGGSEGIPTCFRCGGRGHIAAECPKKLPKRRKAPAPGGKKGGTGQKKKQQQDGGSAKKRKPTKPKSSAAAQS